MNANQDDNMQEKIDAYLNNMLSKKEKETFEKEIETNPKLKEKLQIYTALQESFNNNDWHTLDKNKYKEAFLEIKKELKRESIQDISKHIEKVEKYYFKGNKTSKTKRFYTIAIAASVLLCISISLPFLFVNDGLEDYYNNYQDWEAIPSLIEKGTLDESLKIEILFTEKDYSAIIKYYETNELTNKKLHFFSLLKVGSAYFYSGNYTKAIEVFDKFIALDTLDRSRGYWYKLLVYLKQEDLSKVNEMLNTILSNKANYNYKEALEIKERIK